jgi:pyruvate,orthophosphate dikinase
MARQSAKKQSRKNVRSSNRARSTSKHVYSFGGGKAEGTAKMKELLGGKGANLAEMAGLGLPVPPGFTITTEVCTYFDKHGRKYPQTLRADVARNLSRVESIIGAGFGDPKNPLLVSVRSGARSSITRTRLPRTSTSRPTLR